MEERLLASGILSKCTVFSSKLVAENEAFHIHLVTTTYGDAVSGRGKS